MDPLQEDNVLNYIREINFKQAQALERIITQYGITAEQGMMLGAIDNLDAGTGVLQKDIVSNSRTTAASITSILKGMESRKLIERRSHPKDSRQKTIHILPAGYDIINGFDDAICNLYTATLSTFSTDDLNQFMSLLTRLDKELTERLPDDNNRAQRPDHF